MKTAALVILLLISLAIYAYAEIPENYQKLGALMEERRCDSGRTVMFGYLDKSGEDHWAVAEIHLQRLGIVTARMERGTAEKYFFESAEAPITRTVEFTQKELFKLLEDWAPNYLNSTRGQANDCKEVIR